MVTNQTRVPAGNGRTSGRFAGASHSEPNIDLGAAPTAAASFTPPDEPVNVAPDGVDHQDLRGAKYASPRRADAIAADVRADLEAAVEAGYLPSEVHGRPVDYDVSTFESAGGKPSAMIMRGVEHVHRQAVYITVRGMRDSDRMRTVDNSGRTEPSDLASDITDKTMRIAGAYNRTQVSADGARIEREFYCDASTESEAYAARRQAAETATNLADRRRGRRKGSR